MIKNLPIKIVPEDLDSIKRAPDKRHMLPPWLFKHQELVNALENADSIDQETLINTLNRIHFMNGNILLQLRDPKYDDSILVQAHPEPCFSNELTCRLLDENLSNFDIDSYQFQHIIIDDGRFMIMVPAIVKETDKEYIKIQLPDISFAIGQRKAMRYACKNITAELNQSGFVAKGEMLDFSPLGFRIRVKPESPSSFQWFNSDAASIIHLKQGKQVFFSCPCQCIRQEDKLQDKEIVLTSADEEISRFEKKQMRNPRQHLVPPPALIFNHPFIEKRIQLEVSDISTSGFSILEKTDEGILMPGMIIPELTINFAGALSINCSAQVIYRLEEDQKIRYGLAILDMNINAYSRLAHILSNTLDPNAYISSEVDMDALWEFFFDTGFIYPKKYRLIHSHRKDLKEIYKKLYQESPEIAKHFTYQKHGRIFGHISMVRAYEKAWMLHHYAARTKESKRAGFQVLKQIIYYLNDMHRLPSAKMDYSISYFRPDNKFSDRVFGGFTRALKDPHGSSLDLFAYLPYTSLSLGINLPEKWSLKESSTYDLWELSRFYNHYSGGLLLDALSLHQEDLDDESLEELYSRFGFLRKKKVYSLTHDGELNAVLIVNQSDLGLNLSELLNGIKILVTNPENLPWKVLSVAISQLIDVYNMERVPVIFYPFEYAEANDIPYEKKYYLWVFNVQYGNEYMEYIQRKLRIRY
ncbi:MAG: PilZ domain-containing protein [Desulfobacterales bacterium]